MNQKETAVSIDDLVRENRDLKKRVGEIEDFLKNSNNYVVTFKPEREISSNSVEEFNQVMHSILKNLKPDCLGKYLVVDPETKEYEVFSDGIAAAEELKAKLANQKIVRDGTEFYMLFVDEKDFVKAKAA